MIFLTVVVFVWLGSVSVSVPQYEGWLWRMLFCPGPAPGDNTSRLHPLDEEVHRVYDLLRGPLHETHGFHWRLPVVYFIIGRFR